MLKLLDLSLKLNGFPLEKAKREYAKILAIPENRYREFIEEKKCEIVAFHFENNEFYKSLVGDKLPQNWEDLPVLTKKDLQRPLEERLSRGYKIKNVYVNRTSGSTGNPFIFAKDKFCQAMAWVNGIHKFGWYSIDFNKSYQARFYGIPLNKIKAAKERIKDLLASRYRFSVYDLDEAAMEKILNKFRQKKFDYINGYTTSIVAFGKYLKEKNIVLKNECPTLKVCIVTAEMLFPEDKQMLEETIGVPVVNEYGASELDLIAFQNPAGEWEVNSQTLFVEILDENFKKVPFGEEGKVVITSLYNKAHPFIRYDIGDIGILEKSSDGSKTILKKLIGRSDDIVYLPSGKQCLGWTFSYITKNLIDENGSVKEFLVKQTALDSFVIEYVSNQELDKNQISKIQEGIHNYLEPNLHFTFKKRDFLKRTKAGKLKQFESKLKQ